MVSWTCQRVVLNWPMFRSRGVSRLRDTTVRSRVPGDGNISPWCVPGRQSVASFALHVSQKVPRPGKAPLPGNISPPCIQNELTLARFARHVSEMPCKSPFGNTPREDLATKGSFCCTDPSNHARRANLAIPGCFVWVLRARWGARGAGAAHAARARPHFVRGGAVFSRFISCSFELSPLTRTMPLLLHLLSRETCSLPSRVRRAFCAALREVSTFASRR